MWVYNGERFRYELNAAYKLRLYGSDTSFAFGCESSECDEYYIPIINGKNLSPPCEPPYDDADMDAVQD